MKVSRIVELLYQTYDPDQEIMAIWWGSEGFESKAGAWDKAVKLFDDTYYIPKDMTDFIRDLVTDAEAEVEQEENERLYAELMADQYLERIREEEADV